jgi:glucose/arabinose dehydrogenase
VTTTGGRREAPLPLRSGTRLLVAGMLGAVVVLLSGCGNGDTGQLADHSATDAGADTGERPTTAAPATTAAPGDDEVPVEATPSLENVSVSLRPLAVELDSPTDLQAVGGSLLVTERDGIVVELTPDGGGSYNLAGEVLDIRDEVGSTDGEKGLLGITTNTDGTNLYLNHTRAEDGATVVAEYSLGGAPGALAADDRRELVVIDQPFRNHNAGGMDWGPDQMLWFGTGDGGSGGDPDGRAQRLSDPRGKLLRLAPSSGPGACGTLGASPSTAQPGISGWPTWARTASRRSRCCVRTPDSGAAPISAGTCSRETNRSGMPAPTRAGPRTARRWWRHFTPMNTMDGAR